LRHDISKETCQGCHARHMMQALEKQRISLLQPWKLSESRCFNAPLLYRKNESHFET